jgi:probable HAF family extracellular repeat protein
VALVLLWLLGLASPRAEAAPAYTLTDLGTLGGSMSGATAINDRGQVIGQSTIAPDSFVTHSFFWSPGGGMVDVGTLGGSGTQAIALNNAGQVVGWSDTALGPRHAFSWTSEGGIVDLGTFGGQRSRAAAVNDHGRVVGWSEASDGQQHAFSWTAAGGMVDLGPGIAVDVNDAGQVLIVNGSPFVWTQAGGFVPLGTLGGTFASALAMNERGEVTGTSQTPQGGSAAFYWSAATGMLAIGSLGGFTFPVGVTSSGEVVGHSNSASTGLLHGFSWAATSGMRDLGNPGASFVAQAMNEGGQLVGTSSAGFPSFGLQVTVWTPAHGFFTLGTIAGGPITVAINAAGQVASNTRGVSGEQHAVVWTPAGTPPTITSQASATFTVGSPGSFTITTDGDPSAAIQIAGQLPTGIMFTDNGDGTATIGGTPATASGGIYPLTITASNGNAPDASQSFTLHVEYVFSGFFAPIDGSGANVVNAGQAIPVKFALGGDQGLGILAAGSPRSVRVACDSGAEISIAESTAAAGGIGLSYDSAQNVPAGLYTYVWKTDRSWGGTCRELQLELSDGRTYRARFHFAPVVRSPSHRPSRTLVNRLG